MSESDVTEDFQGPDRRQEGDREIRVDHSCATKPTRSQYVRVMGRSETEFSGVETDEPNGLPISANAAALSAMHPGYL